MKKNKQKIKHNEFCEVSQPFISWNKEEFDKEFPKGKFIDIDLGLNEKIKLSTESFLHLFEKIKRNLEINFEEEKEKVLKIIENKHMKILLPIITEIDKIKAISLLEKMGYKVSKPKIKKEPKKI